MISSFLKSKIHGATVTDSNLEYDGSISIPKDLLDSARIRPFEKVHVYNVTNGERFETYAIEGQKGSIVINGAAAWKAKKDDKIIVATYCDLNEEEAWTHRPRLVFVGPGNDVVRMSDGKDGAP